jgi:hypothetical protein
VVENEWLGHSRNWLGDGGSRDRRYRLPKLVLV